MLFGALEAGGTKMVLAIGNEKGQILESTILPTMEPFITMPKIIDYFKDREILALGVGSFGPIDLNKQSSTYGYITSTPKLSWANYNIVGTLKNALSLPIGFDTDVNCSALGEATWGIARDVESSIYITVGTGIGVGVYINNVLLHGMLHPEAGHILINKHPLDNFTGVCPYHSNCLEGLASGPSIEKRYNKKAIQLEDESHVWELEAYYLAQGIVNSILTISPKKIILGGGVMKQTKLMPLIRAKVLELLNGYIQTNEIKDISNYIVFPSLNDKQGIMGCIKLAMIELGM